MKTLQLLLVAAALALSGCVIWPASGKRELAGTRVEAGQFECIQPGVTTRSNVLDRLSSPAAGFAAVTGFHGIRMIPRTILAYGNG